jgi:outer membrane lipoprotein-sorting protein
MKRIAVVLAVLFSFSGFAQKTDALRPSAPGDLEAVLSQMDQAAGNFKSVEADFQWDQYTKVVNDTDVQKGKLYLQRHGKDDVEAGVLINEPSQKQVVFKEGKVRMYEPKINQITEREVGKNKADVESFMRLGFGERGHDLLKSYEVKMAGWETIEGVKTAKLELIANPSSNIHGMFPRIIWWIDPQQNVSIRQQLFQPSGDYRLAHYSNIKVNAKPSQDFFHFKTTGKTTTVVMKP